MNSPLTVQFRLTKDIWRQFYEAHYAGDQTLKIRYLFGGACILIGAIGIGGPGHFKVVSAAALLFGFYCVLSKPLFVMKSLRVARKHPLFEKEIQVELAPEGIRITGGEKEYRHRWENFVGYRQITPGYQLFLDKEAFFFIPGSACPAECRPVLQSILTDSGLELRK